MSDFRRICCAVDFSAPSRLALEAAAGMARHYRAGLSVLHVSEASAPGPQAVFAPPPRAAEEKEAAELAAWRADAERLGVAEASSVLLYGAAAASIVGFARDEGVDLLVMASHGRTGLKRLLLGSVAEAVMRTAPCSVLIVRRATGGSPP
jgi:nucleotide-binding universal stress UspA family protein